MLVLKAIQFAAEKHKGQERRESGLPYIVHPMIVSHLIVKYKGTSKSLEELQCAALLHDTLEDTECTYKEIERHFGPLVAAIVVELTSDEEEIARIGKNAYLKDKMVKMSKYAFILKLIDRFSNILDTPKEKYVRETLDLMLHLKENRKNLTERQLTIISDIEIKCKRIMNS